MKYIGNATPAWSFGIKHQNHVFQSQIQNNTDEQVKNTKARSFSNGTGPGPGSYHVQKAAEKIMSKPPTWKIGTEKREVSLLI